MDWLLTLGYHLLEPDEDKDRQTQGDQAHQVAQAVDVRGQLHSGIKVAHSLCHVLAHVVVGVVVPPPVQVAVPGRILCGWGSTFTGTVGASDQGEALTGTIVGQSVERVWTRQNGLCGW